LSATTPNPKCDKFNSKAKTQIQIQSHTDYFGITPLSATRPNPKRDKSNSKAETQIQIQSHTVSPTQLKSITMTATKPNPKREKFNSKTKTQIPMQSHTAQIQYQRQDIFESPL
jgi:hypothetical protein